MTRSRWQTERRIKPGLQVDNAIDAASDRSLSDTVTTVTATEVIQHRRLNPRTVGGLSSADQVHHGDLYHNDDDDDTTIDDDRPGAYAITRTGIENVQGEWDPTDHDTEEDTSSRSRRMMDSTTSHTRNNHHDDDDVVVAIQSPAGAVPEGNKHSLFARTTPVFCGERKWLIAIFVAIGLTVVGVVVAFVVLGTQATNAAAPSTTPTTDTCDYVASASQNQQVDPFVQCECFQRVTQVVDPVASVYNSLIVMLNASSDLSMDSCSAENVALLWFASDLVNMDRQEDIGVMLDKDSISRFVLAFLYASWGGTEWDDTTNWLTTSSECVWYGVDCDNNGNLVSLSLPKNNVHGPLDTKLALLQNLTLLDLSDNGIQGKIPSELWKLQHLSKHEDGSDQFVDTSCLTIVCNPLYPTETLNLGRNFITGTMPPLEKTNAMSSLGEFGWLRNRRLYVSIGLHSTRWVFLPSPCPGCVYCTEVIAIDFNGLSGSIPSSISSATSLKSILLNENFLTGSLPPLRGLTNLEHINLNKTMLEGIIPPDWGDLTRLESLDLSQLIGVTGVIPSSFSNLTSLKSWILDSTLIKGTFPEFFGNLVSLEYFSAFAVSFNGTVPTTIGLLENLGKTRWSP